jgi:oxygen-independent coproporphyrinogen-3 oxidase
VPGVYLSYPFCGQKCTYCNFASGVFSRDIEAGYAPALIEEIRGHQWQWRPETVYIGGGTPSRMAVEDIARILAAVPGRPWIEATIEAAPGGITLELAAGWRKAGITRVSLGVQSFAARELRQTGRRHNAETVAREIGILRAAGIDDINVDLIAGLPWQTATSWRESLEWIEKLAPPHVSVYLLEVDQDSNLGLEILGQGSRFGAASIPGEEEMVAFYEYAVDALASIGIERYEISNFARPGRESRHNLKYWRREPYAGFGPDAHGFDGALRSENIESPAGYISRIARGESVRLSEYAARPDEERFFLGLRLMEGVRITPAETERHSESIARLIGAGLLVLEGDRLSITRRGVLLSNEVFQEFIASASLSSAR